MKFNIGDKARTKLNGVITIKDIVDGAYISESGLSWDEGQLSPYVLGRYATFAEVLQIAGSVQWAWDSWLPYSFVTLLVAVSGDGKSYLVARICKPFITGEDWPDGSKFTGQTGKVLWCEAESAQQLNAERIKNMGLSPDDFVVPQLVGNSLDDISLLDRQSKRNITEVAAEPEIKLIVFDSLSGADPTRENDTEKIKVLKWIAELAKTVQKPVIVTHHLNKPGMSSVIDIHRIRGSSSIVQLARVIWAIDIPNPAVKDERRLSVIKSNLAKFPSPLGMSVDPFGNGFIFTNTPPQAPQAQSPIDRATSFLLDLLADGPLPSREIEDAYNAEGMATATINRAKKKIGIMSVTQNGVRMWKLP